MTLREFGSGGWRMYEIPKVQLGLFPEAKDLKTVEGEVKSKAEKLGRDKRFDILFGSLTDSRNLRTRVVDILRQVRGDDEAFAVALDTIAYAKRCNRPKAREKQFGQAVSKIEGCIDNGSLPIGKMKDLLEVGVDFNATTSYWTPELIQKRRDWLNGFDEGPDDRESRKFLDKQTLILILRNSMKIDSVRVEGVETSIEQLSPMHLGRLYREQLEVKAAEQRRKIAEKRRAERFLTTNDW